MDLLATGVLLLHGELVELPGDVVGGTGITIPVGVHSIGHSIGALLLLFFFIFGVAVPALPCFASLFATDLACDEVAVLASPASSTTCTTAAIATTVTTVVVAVSVASPASTIMSKATRSTASALG
jgi:hypothetical protein